MVWLSAQRRIRQPAFQRNALEGSIPFAKNASAMLADHGEAEKELIRRGSQALAENQPLRFASRINWAVAS